MPFGPAGRVPGVELMTRKGARAFVGTCLVTFTTAVLATAAAPQDGAEAGFVSLFDGKSLQGWTAVSTEHFAARDGVIVNDGGTGWLRSEKSYKDFELKLEYRAVKPGSDSGIFFRSSADSTAKAPNWPLKGYQLQVIDSDGNLMIFGHGANVMFDRKAAELKAASKASGEWQSLTLKVVGGHAEVTLNGKLITVSDTISLNEGHIGLQGENGHFEWRAIRLKELPTR